LKRRLLLLIALAITVLFCGNITRARLLWSGGEPANVASANTARKGNAAAGASIFGPLRLNVSEPASLLLLGTVLFSAAELRKRARNSSN
jgi:hypothetical protein